MVRPGERLKLLWLHAALSYQDGFSASELRTGGLRIIQSINIYVYIWLIN